MALSINENFKSTKQIRKLGIFLIIVSSFVSFILAVTASNIEHAELGALINYIWPVVIGVITLLFFLIISFLIKDEVVLKIILVITCLYNLYVGFALHIEKDY